MEQSLLLKRQNEISSTTAAANTTSTTTTTTTATTPTSSNSTVMSATQNLSQTSTPKRERVKEFSMDKYALRHTALRVAYMGWQYKGLVRQADTDQTIEVYDAPRSHHVCERCT